VKSNKSNVISDAEITKVYEMLKISDEKERAKLNAFVLQTQTNIQESQFTTNTVEIGEKNGKLE
jgi:hypothetical protein